MRKLCLRAALAAAIVLAFGTPSTTTRVSGRNLCSHARAR
jgi:hypothetical protein